MTDESEIDLPVFVSYPISFLHMMAMVLGFFVMVVSAPEMSPLYFAVGLLVFAWGCLGTGYVKCYLAGGTAMYERVRRNRGINILRMD